MAARTSIIVCSFSSGLDELTRHQQGDVVAVLKTLKARGRFSSFEATANQKIATLMTRLCHKGFSVVRNGVRTDYGRLIETDNSCGYPWTKVTLTEGGERLLADADAGQIEWSGAPKKETP